MVNPQEPVFGILCWLLPFLIKEGAMVRKNSRPLKMIGMLLTLFLGFVVSTNVAAAAEYPDKPIKLIVPMAPGGSIDIVGRIMATKLGERLGHPVVVENRPGAGGTVGVAMAANAKPDGYTLVQIAASYVINNAVYIKLPYDPAKAFIPVAKFGEGQSVFTVYPGLPVNSLKELVALAKKEPGKLNYSAAGVGSFGHLGAEYFMKTVDIDVVAVQFKGAGPAMTDTAGGHTQITFGSIMQALPQIQSHMLKPLATAGKKRSALLPNVPTVAEQGYPGFEASTWWGILAPAGTPQTVVDRLSKEIEVIMASAETQKIFLSQGADLDYMGAAEFSKYMGAESAKWEMVVKKAGVRMSQN
jgi:tripartite-type tricarboxylate transporter receptor subunit TctC